MIPLSATPRLPLDTRASLSMLVFCLTFGLQQVAMKSVADAITPLVQAGLRSLIAALLVMALMHWRGIRLFERGHVIPGLLIGSGYALEFICVAFGLNFTYAAHMSVFLYTAPVFAAVGLHLFVPGEQLSARHWAGVLIAFAGMITALAPSADLSPAILLGDLLGVGGAIAWAGTTLLLRTTRMAGAPPLQPAAYQLIVTALVLLPLAGVLGDLGAIRMTPLAWGSLMFQVLAVAFAALLLWLWLLTRYLAWQLGVFSFLTPIFGVAFGVVLLGEPATANFVAGGLAILVGLTLVSVRKRSRPAQARRA